MKNCIFKPLTAIALSSFLTFGLSQTAQAELLELPSLNFPQVVFDNTGTTDFNSDTGILSTNALPIAARFSSTTAPVFINPGADGESVTINVQVDSAGNLVGGVSGDDLVIIGEIDTDNDGTADYSGTLLTGEVLDFGFEDSGPNDLFNYSFAITGGALAGDYPTGNIGISIISELSNFSNFLEAFDGRSKGTIGQIPTIVTSCSVDVLGSCSVMVPPEKPACDAKIAATTLKYTGPTLLDATVILQGKHGGYATYTTDLISGETILTSVDENGYTIDGRGGYKGDLGSKLKVYINGVGEVIHTSCSVPYVVGEAAPLNDGSSSSNWMVEAFVDKHGNVVAKTLQTGLTCEIPANTSAEVTFSYDVTNTGDFVIDSVDVTDSFGVVPNSPLGALNPGESAYLDRIQTISGETENVVTVNAFAGSVSCSNMTAVTILEVEPEEKSCSKCSHHKCSKDKHFKCSKDKHSKCSTDKHYKSKHSKLKHFKSKYSQFKHYKSKYFKSSYYKYKH